MAKPGVCDLHRHGRAVQHHDLVAPVELIRLARRKAQRHIGLRQRRAALLAPGLGITADRVVTAVIAQLAQRLEDPDQRQPLTRLLRLVLRQQPVEISPPGAELRLRLLGPRIAKLGRLRPQHLAHDLPGQTQLPANHLDRLLLDEMRPPDLPDRLHYQHPKPGLHVAHGSHCEPTIPGVPFGRRSPRKRGPYSALTHI